MAKKYDAVVIGAGIAGLGIAGLLQRAGMNTLCVDDGDRPGGRMQTFDMDGGWQVDHGLHMVELGAVSPANEIVEKVGKKVNWGPPSESVDFFIDGDWVSLEQFVGARKDAIPDIVRFMKKMAKMTDAEIEDLDLTSWQEWLEKEDAHPGTKEIFLIEGMIITTVPEGYSMSAGEILFVMRDNLNKANAPLTSSYPVGGMRGIVLPQADAFTEAGGTLMLNTIADSVVFDENNNVKGVRIEKKGISPYFHHYYVGDYEEIEAPVVVCALPLWSLDRVLDCTHTSPLPEWWIRRYLNLKMQTTGLIGWSLGFKDEFVKSLHFHSALKARHAQVPYQGVSPTSFDPSVAPDGKGIFQTDIVVEPSAILDKFELARMLDLMWKDLQEMYPGFEDRLEWAFPYKCMGCDGLARQPGQVGHFKPELTAPGVDGLYFAGDCYKGRGLAINAAATSGMLCADLILDKYGK